jgi:hypothetical protein
MARWATRPIRGRHDTNAERDYIIAELRKNQVIADVNSYQARHNLVTEHVNHYVTDGEVVAASLVVQV